ncbi:pyruvate dehydrogenase [Cercophora scortea]|uniref:Pyruvate dehydrogenase n=1 Tax=Cercophora scortea TaxID=314031 RepID=A0AAE0I9Q1_9PEZI|nr:pyruvate dehydrogenase [Cercophora scortea]
MENDLSMPLLAGMAAVATCIAWLNSPNRGKAVPRLDNSDYPATTELIVPRGPTRDEVTRMLNRNAYSYKVRNVMGVDRYDGAQLGSNTPCEDFFSHGEFDSPWEDGATWLSLGVFDGHAGSQVAQYLSKHLIRFIRHSLNSIGPEYQEEDGTFSDEVVQQAIQRGFTTLDDAIVDATAGLKSSTAPWQDKIKTLELGYSGSCALQALFDPASRKLHVACTGDSRAVLGYRREDGSWEAIPLSVDQNMDNGDEIARINAEHPGEDHLFNSHADRLLGLTCLRTFGNVRWKIPFERQKTLWLRYQATEPLGWRQEPPWVRTPPYVTAEPVVTSTYIPPETPAFLIMACDGVWDWINSQQAVNLVGLWVDAKIAASVAADFTLDESISNLKPSKNPPPPPTYPPYIRHKVGWAFTEERTTVRDDNAAVHLLRNVLGGNHEEMINGRVTFSSPHSRDVRDDLTAQVAFFNTGLRYC